MFEIRDLRDEWNIGGKVKIVIAWGFVLHERFSRRLIAVNRLHRPFKVSKVNALENVLSIVKRRHQHREEPLVIARRLLRFMSVECILFQIAVLREYNYQWKNDLANRDDAAFFRHALDALNFSEDVALRNASKAPLVYRDFIFGHG